jgi:hypothetical protein
MYLFLLATEQFLFVSSLSLYLSPDGSFRAAMTLACAILARLSVMGAFSALYVYTVEVQCVLRCQIC